jgi:SAM-dependent methyltransferase
MAMTGSPAAGASMSGSAAPRIYGFPRFEASPERRPGYNGPPVMRGVEQIPWLYDAVCAACEAFGLARWRRWLVAGARGRVLDLGCGTGRNLPLLPPGTVAVGLDPSWASLQRARRRAPGVPVIVGSAEALPFRNAAFDTVLSGLVFCSVPDARRGLLEARRVLGPRGRLRMLEHVRAREPWKARLQDRMQPAWTWVTGGCHPNRDTERVVEASGFTIESEGRRARGNMRRFVAAPRESSS